MTDDGKVVGLRTGEPIRRKGEPVPALIATLEGLLERARSGELQYLAGAGISDDNGAVSFWAGDNTRPFTVIGALTMLHHRHVTALNRGEVYPSTEDGK